MLTRITRLVRRVRILDSQAEGIEGDQKMKITTVVISKTFEEYAGNKLQERTAIRLEDLEVESLISEAEFIPLSNDFRSYSPSDAVTLHETEATLDFVKDAK